VKRAVAGAETSVANSASTPASSLRARLVDGTARVFLAEALIVPTGLLTVAYLTRRLDLSEYGRYTLAVALLVWLEWGLAAPFGRAAVRLIGAATDWRPIASLVVRTQFVVGAVMAVVLWLTAPLVAAAFHEPTLTSLLRWLSLDLPLFGVSHAHQQVLVALGRFRVRALVSLVRWTTRLALIVAAVEAGLSVRGVILAIVGTSAVEIAFARRFVRPPIFRRSDVSVRRLFEYALPLLVTALSLRLFDRVDVVLLKLLGRSAAEVGVYGAAQSLTVATGLFTSAFSPLLVATVTRSVVGGDHSRARELGRDSMRLVVLLFPLAAILAASAREIVPLILGADYLPGVDVFQCLIFAGVMNVAVSVGCALLVGAGKPAWTLRVAMPLPVIAILAHAWAIPRFGPVGAAAVTMTCAAFGAAFAFLAIHHVWQVAPASTSAIRSVVVAIVGAIVAAAWSTPGFLVVVKLGILAVAGLFVLCVAGEFGNPIALASRARQALLGRLVDQQ
jgi:O-antigen/teichoic acid export membrane protein